MLMSPFWILVMFYNRNLLDATHGTLGVPNHPNGNGKQMCEGDET